MVSDGIRVFPMLCAVRQTPIRDLHQNTRVLGHGTVRVHVNYHCSHSKPAPWHRVSFYFDRSCRPHVASAGYWIGYGIVMSLHSSAVLASRRVRDRAGPTLRTMAARTSPSKSLPIVAGPGADSPQEGSSHRIRAGKAAARCHALQSGFALLEQSPRRIDPRHFDEVRGRGAGLDLKDPGKATHAHGDPRSQRIQAQIVREMIENPMLQGSNLPLVSDLRCQMRTELRLTAGTLQKHH